MSAQTCRGRTFPVVMAIVALTIALTSCASTARLGGPTHSCSTGFHPANALGSISAQQRGRGYGIQWGVYPNVTNIRYVVDVYINQRRVDHKEQNYPSHGSVNARNVRTGDIFRLEGSATNGKGDIARFYLTCRAE